MNEASNINFLIPISVYIIHTYTCELNGVMCRSYIQALTTHMYIRVIISAQDSMAQVMNYLLLYTQ